jgi:hypothetical protein
MNYRQMTIRITIQRHGNINEKRNTMIFAFHPNDVLLILLL